MTSRSPLRTSIRSAYQGAKALLPTSIKAGVKRAIAIHPNARYESLWLASANLWQELRIVWWSRGARRRWAALGGRTGLKVHLGCGNDLRPGWVNVDLDNSPALKGQHAARRDALFLSYDLRLGLPLPPSSCDYIYSSHFFEHLAYHHGLKLIGDCYRALGDGGVFRIALPNLRAIFRAYLDQDAQYFEPIEATRVLGSMDPAQKTIVDYVNYAVYQSGEHRQIYDQEKLAAILRQVGFRSIAESSYQAGIDPDSPLRRWYSFYMEAVK
jgi:SAM-dependent methyltransferase